jgi:hypothetical protein
MHGRGNERTERAAGGRSGPSFWALLPQRTRWCPAGQVGSALRFLDLLLAHGDGVDPRRLAQLLGITMDAAARRRELHGLEGTLERMRSAGINPSTRSLTSLIHVRSQAAWQRPLAALSAEPKRGLCRRCWSAAAGAGLRGLACSEDLLWCLRCRA